MKKISLSLLFLLAACAGTNVGQQPRVSDQRLGYATDGSVQVQPGDTVYSIARRHNVPMSAIITTNSLKAPYVLQPGQTIQLPDNASSGASTATVSQLPYDRSVGGTDLGGSVQPESLAPLGTSDASISAAPLDGAPPIEDANASKGVDKTEMVLTPTGPITTPAPGEEPALANTPTALLPEAQPAAAANTVTVPPKPGMFSWPVQGPVVSSYGSQAGGATNAGINITAPKGTPVQAAGSGTVIQASDAGDMGKTVLIQHPDGYVTSYGHLDRVLVEKDSVVANGDVVGTVGQSGSVKAPQVHFEIRQAGKPVDPSGYLPAK